MKTENIESELSLYKAKLNVLGNIQEYTLVAKSPEDLEEIIKRNIIVLSAEKVPINSTGAIIGDVENITLAE